MKSLTKSYMISLMIALIYASAPSSFMPQPGLHLSLKTAENPLILQLGTRNILCLHRNPEPTGQSSHYRLKP